MNYIALTPRTGRPMPDDLVWSALPDAPVVEPKNGNWRVRFPARRAARRQ